MRIKGHEAKPAMVQKIDEDLRPIIVKTAAYLTLKWNRQATYQEAISELVQKGYTTLPIAESK